MTLQLGKARIHYHSRWVVAYLKPDIPGPDGVRPWRRTMKYYLSLIPNAYNVQPQKYEPHITVVRLEKEPMPEADVWAKKPRHGEIIRFAYDTTIQQDGSYFYLSAWSPELMRLRVDLGLPPLREGYFQQHITIGNIKGA